MENKKSSVLAVLEILEEYSDEDHILSTKDILERLRNEYDVDLDRRTLYRNVDMLIDFGYDISNYTENGSGYYLRERQFHSSEIFLLCNAIHSSNYIPNNESKDLINKLLKTQSRYYRNYYRNTVYVDNSNKKENKEFFLNVEMIAEAIKEKKTISFNYLKYNEKKQLVKRREEPYVYSPYYLVSMNEKTYVVCKSKNHDDFVHFRVDRMKNVDFPKEKYIKLNKDEDPYQYAKSKIYMYGGKEERIAIRFDEEALDNMIDIFGKSISIQKENDLYTGYLKASRQGMIFLALQYLNHLEIIEPEDLREEVKKALKNGVKKYK